jgi:crossover junction endodeoxyribonuclease RuvC
MPRCLLLAIDPGSVSGAYAAFFDGSPPEVGDLPVVNKQVNAASLATLVRNLAPEAGLVENVASMPKQGVASTFRFGVGTGIVHGVLAGANVPFELVAPTVWKKRLGLVGRDKEAGRALAIRLYPQLEGSLHRVRDHGRADALLMGRWLFTKDDPTNGPAPATAVEPDSMGLGRVLWQPANIGDDYD